MKFKIILFTVLLFSVSISVFAKPVLIDSIGVKNQDGKKVIIFKVQPKDTYYSIARRYNVSPQAIMNYNNSKTGTLTIGDVINIPTDQPFAKSAPAPAQQQVQGNNTPPTEYKVSAGETLYAISKRFNTTVEDITKLNNLTSTTLVPGQILMVRYGSSTLQQTTSVVHTDTQAIAKRDSTLTAPMRDSAAERRFNANKFGLYEKTEKGVATWIDDSSLDPNKKLVLHRTALIGTVIKITNPMTNRTTFAKVVGRFTDNEQTKDVIIIMTKNVADSLGALDKRFHVNISYGSPNE
jgi:LysM repeat protein